MLGHDLVVDGRGMETFLQEAQNLPYWLQFLSVVVLALVGGSFLNVVIFRLPIALFASNGASGESAADLSAGEQHLGHVDIFKMLGWPRSYCPACRTTLRTIDLFPILSFLLLGGKCRYCASPIRYTYPVVEALTALIVGLLFYRLGFGLDFLVAVVLVSFLIVLAAIDIRYMILPDELTMPLLWCGLLVNTTFRVAPLGEAVVGAVFGYLSLFLVNFVFFPVEKEARVGWRGHEASGCHWGLVWVDYSSRDFAVFCRFGVVSFFGYVYAWKMDLRYQSSARTFSVSGRRGGYLYAWASRIVAWFSYLDST